MHLKIGVTVPRDTVYIVGSVISALLRSTRLLNYASQAQFLAQALMTDEHFIVQYK